MSDITLGQVATYVGVLSTIGAFFIAIYKWYKKTLSDKLLEFDKRITQLEIDSKTNKEENTILLKGQLACLKGLKEQGCDGPVTKSINEIEEYLLKQAHK